MLTSARCILNNFNCVLAQVHLWQLGVHSGLRGSGSDFRQIIFTRYKRKKNFRQSRKKKLLNQLDHYPDEEHTPLQWIVED